MQQQSLKVTETLPASNGNAETIPASDEPILSLILKGVENRLQGKLKADISDLQGTIESTVSGLAADLEARIAAKLAELRPAPIKVEVRQGDVITTIDGAHRQIPQLLSRLAQRRHVYIWGAPGGGKSFAAHQAAKALGLRYAYASLNEQSPDYLLIGYKDANRVYDAPLFRDFYENGGIFVLEECDNATGSLLSSLNACLENGLASFPDGMVSRHPDFVVVALGNTSGRGAHPAFPERRAFDAAFADRFTYIQWFYDDALQLALVQAIDPERAEVISDWTIKARDYAERNGLRVILSPRSALQLALDWTNKHVDDSELIDSVLKGIDAVARDKLLANVPFPRREPA